MNVTAVLERYDDEVRANIADEPGIRVERSEQTVRITGLWDCVIHSTLSEETADAAIALEKARASQPRHLSRARGGSRTRSTRARLSVFGGRCEGHEPTDLKAFGLRAAHDRNGLNLATRTVNRTVAAPRDASLS